MGVIYLLEMLKNKAFLIGKEALESKEDLKDCLPFFNNSFMCLARELKGDSLKEFELLKSFQEGLGDIVKMREK